MNLYFNLTLPNEDSIHLASAILRLYRIQNENFTQKISETITNDSYEEKLTRITIFWYVKPSKKTNGN